MNGNRCARAVAVACGVAALAGPLAASAAAVPDCPGSQPTRVVLSGQGTLESVISDAAGRLYYTDVSAKALMRLDSPGAAPQPVVTGIDSPGGLAFEPDGTLIVGYGDAAAKGATGASNPQAGLLRVNLATGAHTVLATGLQMSNGVARGPDGTIYASNDFGSSLDRVFPTGMVQLGFAQVQSGNGLAVDTTGRYLFAAQTFVPAQMSRVDLTDPSRVEQYAAPGPADISAGLDGLTRDEHDRVFVAANGGGQVWRVDPDRSICALARGLITPSAVAFGGGRTGFVQTSLYAVTFGGLVVELPNARPVPATNDAVNAPAPVGHRSTTPRLRIRVAPRRVRAGTSTAFAFDVTTGRVTVSGARVRFAGRTAVTDRTGRASMIVRLRRAGSYSAKASKRGYLSARTAVRARHA
jgi:sugar lactone lactonase YvrE